MMERKDPTIPDPRSTTKARYQTPRLGCTPLTLITQGGSPGGGDSGNAGTRQLPAPPGASPPTDQETINPDYT